jgi:8-oxo-dGTP diphosphatase
LSRRVTPAAYPRELCVDTFWGVAHAPGILARGPWLPDAVEVSWREDEFRPTADATQAADQALDALRARGSPSHDGLAARLAGFGSSPEGLRLELQPVRWALRLLGDDAARSLSALCVVRGADGSWLAGRRAAWLASWAGRWALGAGGSVEVGENPAETLGRELREEWSVDPERLRIEALVLLPSQVVLLVGQAWLAEGATVAPDHEHDEFAWWPAEVDRWPAEADEPLRRMGALLAAAER